MQLDWKQINLYNQVQMWMIFKLCIRVEWGTFLTFFFTVWCKYLLSVCTVNCQSWKKCFMFLVMVCKKEYFLYVLFVYFSMWFWHLMFTKTYDLTHAWTPSPHMTAFITLCFDQFPLELKFWFHFFTHETLWLYNVYYQNVLKAIKSSNQICTLLVGCICRKQGISDYASSLFWLYLETWC